MNISIKLNPKKYVLLLAAVLVGVVFLATAPHAFAVSNTSTDICNGLQLTGANNCNDTSTLSGIVKKVISILGLVVGVTAVIMIIVAGFKFITSAGDAQKAASARNTIIYAVIGLVVAALSEFIVSFVLKSVG